MTVSVEATNFISPFVKILKISKDEYKHFFDIGLENYLRTQTEKYLYANTFLHRGEKVNFYNIYFPIRAKYGRAKYYFSESEKVFQKFQFITIIGLAGSGKSTLIKFIFLNSIRQNFKIPILVELRHLNDFDGNLEKLILDKIISTDAEPSVNIARRTMKNGGFLFLLDGYDEIYIDKKQKVNKQIDQFVDSYSNNHFVMTTRPGSGIEGFARFHNFEVEGLTSKEIIQFVNLMVKDLERRQRITKTIKDPINQNYSQYLSIPLLLSMFILAFESHPEIPSKKTAFYRNVFDTLYSKHDGITKNSFPRDKKTKLQREDFQKILELFSFLSYTEGQYAFTENQFSEYFIIVKKRFDLNEISVENLLYDLETSISIFIKDGYEYKFPHRSMQEYFAAEFASKVSSEKKHAAYSNLFIKESINKVDNSHNLWAISIELDEIPFIREFILPELIKIQLTIADENPSIFIQNFLKYLEPCIHLNSVDEDDYPGQLKLYRNVSFFNDIIQYNNIFDFIEVFNFLQTSKAELPLLKYLEKLDNWDSDDYSNIQQDIKAINILIKFGFKNLVDEFHLNLNSKIEELKKRVTNDTFIIDEILGI